MSYSVLTILIIDICIDHGVNDCVRAVNDCVHTYIALQDKESSANIIS